MSTRYDARQAAKRLFGSVECNKGSMVDCARIALEEAWQAGVIAGRESGRVEAEEARKLAEAKVRGYCGEQATSIASGKHYECCSKPNHVGDHQSRPDSKGIVYQWSVHSERGRDALVRVG